MSGRERTDALASVAEIAGAVRGRLAGPRRAHVERVVETAARIAAAGGWPRETRAAAERAAWWHDALKPDGPAAWRATIEAAGEVPDPWAVEHGPGLLHAQAAAVWAAGRGERDPEVLAAVRHHPTAHAGWGAVGRILYVADFTEPGRDHSGEVGADRIVAGAGQGEAGLAAAAIDVLARRIAWLLARRRRIHPDSLAAWNAWVGGDETAGADG